MAAKDQQKITIEEDIYDDLKPVIRSVGNRTFNNWSNNISVKSDYSRDDYNYFRGGSTGKSRQSILTIAQEAYDKVSIIKNVIDLMGDFGSKGIRIRHPDKKIDNFCKKWSEKVNVPDRSERFLNSLYRLGAAIPYASYGRASNSITSKYIPVKYTFLNPSSVEVKGQDKAIIPKIFRYVIRYSNNALRHSNTNGATTTIPEELKKYKDGIRELPEDRVSVYNYKKDDWEFWANPLIYSLIDDLKVLEKLKLSDISALDGVISSVRLWNIGVITDNPQTTILPTKPTLQKFQKMLANNISGGSMDVVCGPEVSFQESSTSIHQFLGEAKYKPTLDSIYDGLGIPSPLRSSNKDNNSSNAISLKTLIERLNYGRMQLIDFWTKELKKVFNTLGFKTDKDPIIEFDYMVLVDEAAEKKLLLDMIDRDIVDIETVHERFNITNEITNRNLQEEISKRGNKLPVKAGPFHNAHIEDNMKGELLKDGMAYPGEIGLDISLEDKEYEKRLAKKQKAEQKKKQNSSSQFSNVPGRPKNITETKKRETKSSAIVELWASKAQKEISSIYTPIVLKVYGKKNVRSLTEEETANLENAKAKILFGMEPMSQINEESIQKSISNKIDITPLNNFLSEASEELGSLTVDQKRQLNSIFYANIKVNDE